jgi:methyltransferase (TIGR00027 family)
MRAGQASRTAVLVCMGRAIGHKTTQGTKFSDPTALELLPDRARAYVDGFDPRAPPRGLLARARHGYLRSQSIVMVVRTVEIDEGIRTADPGVRQLVILGAGLDGRAWRMGELRDWTVFEVDHPDSQREKKPRTARLTPTASDVRFVPVDFTRDSLDGSLAKAGHDPSKPTVWVWEGVVMYLSPDQVRATLGVIARRSAAGSRLLVTYHAPAALLWLVGFAVRRLGEPFRSRYAPEAMRALLEEHGLRVVRDDTVPGHGARHGLDLMGRQRYLKHLRVATADRG